MSAGRPFLSMSDSGFLPLRPGEAQSLESVQGGVDGAAGQARLLHDVESVLKPSGNGVEDQDGAEAEVFLLGHEVFLEGYVGILVMLRCTLCIPRCYVNYEYGSEVVSWGEHGRGVGLHFRGSDAQWILPLEALEAAEVRVRRA